MNTSTTDRPKAALVIGLLALAHFIVSVDFNIVFIALPEIGREVGFSAQTLQWVVSAFALGFGGFLLLGGRAADRFGPRRVFVAGLALFGAASVAGGLSDTPWLLVAARGGQGLGAALLFPATLALIGTQFPEGAARNRAMAVWGTAGAFGALAGGGVGGMLTSTLGWRSVFFAVVPLVLLALAGAVRLLAADPGIKGGSGGFDLPGAILATGGSLLVVFGLVRGPEFGWATLQGAGAVAAGAALVCLFLLVERRARDPLVPLRLFKVRTLAVAIALIFLIMGPVSLLHYLYTTYLQDVLHYSPLSAGLGFLPQGLVAMAGSAFLLPVLLERWGLRATLFTGVLGVGATVAVFSLGLSVDGSYWLLLPGLVLLGLTAGTVYPAIFTAAGTGVASQEQGVASAMTSTAQQVGGAMGLAVFVAAANMGADLAAVPAESPEAVVAGLRLAGWTAAAVTAAGAFLALLVHRGRVAVAGESADQQREGAPTGS